MDTTTTTRSRVRTGVAIVLGLATLTGIALGLAVVRGLAEEYGRGSVTSLLLVVATPPLLLAVLAVLALPRATTPARAGLVLATAIVVIAGGLAADALGSDAHHDRLLQESRDFSCNGPNAEVQVPAVVDRTWRELPRPAPVYGPIEGSATHCVAGVAGDGDRTFTAVTDAFRDLEGWQVAVDQPGRFVIARHGVRVTVLLRGAPDRLTTIGVSAGRAEVVDARAPVTWRQTSR